LNWRIEEPDGEFLSRDALQNFVQDEKWPAHLINHDNEYLHYKDDWYVLDYEPDNNAAGVPPFALIYYRGSNDAWDGYGGAVVYTRDSKLPESLIPRLRDAVKKVNFDFDKDFTITGKYLFLLPKLLLRSSAPISDVFCSFCFTFYFKNNIILLLLDNTCKTIDAGEAILLKEKFAGKMAIQTEKQLLQQLTLARNLATNSVQAQKLFFANELDQAEKAVAELAQKAAELEDEVSKKVVQTIIPTVAK
jgi:violaxanthin de-epoxidase